MFNTENGSWAEVNIVLAVIEHRHHNPVSVTQSYENCMIYFFHTPIIKEDIVI